MRIVIAEDEKITRLWVKKQIEKLRPAYDLVETFANGREALEYMESHEADVLFTDIRMPVMDGLELLGELQRREDGAYKVILSAYDEFHYAQQALRLGANEFTLKPEITKEELGRILENAESWLEKQRKGKEVLENPQEAGELWMQRFLARTGQRAGELCRTSQGERAMQNPEESERPGQREKEPKRAMQKPKESERAGQREKEPKRAMQNPEESERPGQREKEPKQSIQKPERLEADLRAHGIDLCERNLRAACISFPGGVPRERVLELLQLFLAEEKVKYFCMQLDAQSFGVFFNQGRTGDREGPGRRLWELLQAHIGTDVYIGLSDVKDGYEQLGELFGQAVAAKKSRQFFGISGCLCYTDLRSVFPEEDANRRDFRSADGNCAGDEKGNPGGDRSGRRMNSGKSRDPGDTVQEILDAAEAGDFEGAKERTVAFFAAAGEARDLNPVCVIAPGCEILTGYIRRLRAYSLNGEESARLRQCELLLGRPAAGFRQFREEMLEAVGFLSDMLEQKERRSSFSPAVQNIIQYVEENYGERISLEQVAAAAFLSRSYASALFKKETGEKFSDYLQRVRIEKSCGLLRDSSLSIQETAERTGFFDAAHFSRVFKEKMGMSPMEYRKKRRQAHSPS